MKEKLLVTQNITRLFIVGLILLAMSCQTNGTHNKSEESLLLSEHKTTEMSPTIDSIFLQKSFVTGKFDPEDHSRFKLIDARYADREGMWMLDEAYDSFVKMYDAALAEEVKLEIKSAARNFSYQKGIWERKWTGETTLSDGIKANTIEDPSERALKILLYSSMPSTSRHHWGTDIDLNSFSNTYFSSGEGLKIYSWLQKHAHEYGFCQPYISKENGRTGYEEERWHWSYIPISRPLVHFYQDQVVLKDIFGFAGSETASSLDVINQYVLGINQSCL